MPTSTLPERVAIGTPSFGVKPIVVSTLCLSTTPQMLEPAPRWHVIRRRGGSPRISPVRRAA